jgi:hypothetical protein
MTNVPIPEAPTDGTLLPEPGLYRHFKGGEYELLAVARHSETDELLAIYRAVGDPERVWVRPLTMFTETIQAPTGVFPRFELRSIRRSVSAWPDPAPSRAGLYRWRHLWDAILARARNKLRAREHTHLG